MDTTTIGDNMPAEGTKGADVAATGNSPAGNQSTTDERLFGMDQISREGSLGVSGVVGLAVAGGPNIVTCKATCEELPQPLKIDDSVTTRQLTNSYRHLVPCSVVDVNNPRCNIYFMPFMFSLFC
jgi:hypothetical protein